VNLNSTGSPAYVVQLDGTATFSVSGSIAISCIGGLAATAIVLTGSYINMSMI
jgi:hypothetical protein